MAEFFGTAFVMGMMGAILQYLLTGSPPSDPLEDPRGFLKDIYFPRTGRTRPDGSPERLRVPSYTGDYVGWVTNPGRTIKNKMHPIVHLGADAWYNEDFYGTEIRHPDDPWWRELDDFAKYAATTFIPFSFRNYQEYRKDDADHFKAALLGVFGLNVAPGYICKSPAQKLMIQYHRASMPAGSRTKEQSARAQLLANVIHRLRMGRPIDDLPGIEMLSGPQIAQCRKDARLPPFAASFAKLKRPDHMLNVYLHATDEERDAAAPYVQRKMYTTAMSRGTGRSSITPNEWETIQRLYEELKPDIVARIRAR